MLRDARYKYVYHVGGMPQLFDMVVDPSETDDLGTSGEHKNRIEEFEKCLRALIDPEETDAMARQDQREKVEAFGGKEAVLRRGSFDNSPVPGEPPAFQKFQP
jgi:hypothetical protein